MCYSFYENGGLFQIPASFSVIFKGAFSGIENQEPRVPLITTAWRVLRLRLEVTASGYGR
jgi:hypothetical protein